MGLFDIGKEIKDEVKALVAASRKTAEELVRLQERVQRAEGDYERTLQRFENLISRQDDAISALRDRVTKLEAQRDALHNNARILAMQFARENGTDSDPAGFLPVDSDA